MIQFLFKKIEHRLLKHGLALLHLQKKTLYYSAVSNAVFVKHADKIPAYRVMYKTYITKACWPLE